MSPQLRETWQTDGLILGPAASHHRPPYFGKLENSQRTCPFHYTFLADATVSEQTLRQSPRGCCYIDKNSWHSRCLLALAGPSPMENRRSILVSPRSGILKQSMGNALPRIHETHPFMGADDANPSTNDDETEETEHAVVHSEAYRIAGRESQSVASVNT